VSEENKEIENKEGEKLGIESAKVSDDMVPEDSKEDKPNTENEDIFEVHVEINRKTGEFLFIKRAPLPSDALMFAALIGVQTNSLAMTFLKPKKSNIVNPNAIPGGAGVNRGARQNPGFFKKVFR